LDVLRGKTPQPAPAAEAKPATGEPASASEEKAPAKKEEPLRQLIDIFKKPREKKQP
jgi:hypothetical protein